MKKRILNLLNYTGFGFALGAVFALSGSAIYGGLQRQRAREVTEAKINQGSEIECMTSNFFENIKAPDFVDPIGYYTFGSFELGIDVGSQVRRFVGDRNEEIDEYIVSRIQEGFTYDINYSRDGEL